MALRVFSAVLFFPRGGSAHASRALSRGLRAQGCEVVLLAGSRSGLGGHGDARRFYGDVHAVDFDPALASGSPLHYEGRPGTAPMHPSFEDRPGAPDAVFASLDDLEYELQVRAWAREFQRAGADRADVALLHHLTPLNEAMARTAPHVPVVGQLHGTELLMLERVASGPPPSWRHAAAWAQRMRDWAQRCALLLISPSSLHRAAALLDVPADKLVALPSGVDIDAFSPRRIDRGQFWDEVLVQRPQGWLPGQDAGSVNYAHDAVSRLRDATILLYVGRFTAVKRLDRLIAAFARAQRRTRAASALVLVGGHPGEWEGEHPAEIVARVQPHDVFLAGWHDHEQLPEFFSAADVTVTTSAREQFGLVLVEGMACGLPVLATRSPGPELIVEEGRTGWLVSGDDESALVDAMVQAIDDPEERRRRGHAAMAVARERYSWEAIAASLAAILADVAGRGREAPAAQAECGGRSTAPWGAGSCDDGR